MPIIFTCKYCGKHIIYKINYEGKMTDFAKWMKDKENRLSEECECGKLKV